MVTWWLKGKKCPNKMVISSQLKISSIYTVLTPQDLHYLNPETPKTMLTSKNKSLITLSLRSPLLKCGWRNIPKLLDQVGLLHQMRTLDSSIKSSRIKSKISTSKVWNPMKRCASEMLWNMDSMNSAQLKKNILSIVTQMVQEGT